MTNLKSKWLWFRNYTVPKRQEMTWWWLAGKLPTRLRYFAFMLELGRRTAGPGVPVPEKTVNEILHFDEARS